MSVFNEKYQGYSGNPTDEDLMALVNALIDNIMRNLHVATLAKVVDSANLLVQPFPTQNEESEKQVKCVKADGLTLTNGDIVLVIYTDRDFRQNLNQIKNRSQISKVLTKEYHSEKFGIIINKIEI